MATNDADVFYIFFMGSGVGVSIPRCLEGEIDCLPGLSRSEKSIMHSHRFCIPVSPSEIPTKGYT